MKYGILTFDQPVADTSKKIIHVDMDAFYASVEIRDDPSLANRPVIIAKHPNLTGGRGIVTTCNYIARKYGIHSAMSSHEAYQRCKTAVFIPPNLQYYRQVSYQIREIMFRYTEIIEPVSLDEAYLDVTDNKFNLKSATIIGQAIQKSIYQELSLTASIGVSYNKYIAKIASDYQKPLGMTVIEPQDAVSFLKSLPIDKFPGVGRRTLPLFHELDIHTGNDLYNQSIEWLMDHFGKLGYSLYYRVRGVSSAKVSSERNRKSLGKERTFRQFLKTEKEVLDQIDKIIQLISERHNLSNLRAHTLTLKIRYEDFETLTRQFQNKEAITTVDESKEIAYNLWHNHGLLDKSIRLIGITYSNFDNPKYEYISLF